VASLGGFTGLMLKVQHAAIMLNPEKVMSRGADMAIYVENFISCLFAPDSKPP